MTSPEEGQPDLSTTDKSSPFRTAPYFTIQTVIPQASGLDTVPITLEFIVPELCAREPGIRVRLNGRGGGAVHPSSAGNRGQWSCNLTTVVKNRVSTVQCTTAGGKRRDTQYSRSGSVWQLKQEFETLAAEG